MGLTGQWRNRKNMSKSHHQDQRSPHRTALQAGALFYVVIHGFCFWAIARSMSAEASTIALALFGLSSMASVVAGIAMWFWKRWGIYLYVVATFALGGTVLLKTGSLNMMFGAILPMIVVIYIFKPAYKYFR